MLALFDKRIVGVVRYRPSPKRDGLYVRRLAVDPEYRRHKIGTLLMERTEQHAQETQQNSLVLEVRKDLTRNQKFFESLGYKQEENMNNYYLMRKVLKNSEQFFM